ncbi:uncharacterized protein BcabD6B2_25270 [Babesia caballi]|uniref:Uncharacterized protein n=1 Tax=Babesia caballi TaxID=5871 RepID=A0AAV4LTK6_BABCB|nr:hypothetical protein, conserved [Babesia caballi]
MLMAEVQPGDVVESGDGLVGEVGGWRFNGSLKVARERIEKGRVGRRQLGIGALWLRRRKLTKAFHCTLHHNFALLIVEVIITVTQGDHYVSEAGASRIMKSLLSPRPAVMAQPVELGEAVVNQRDAAQKDLGAGLSFSFFIDVPLTSIHRRSLVIRHVRFLEVPDELLFTSF